METMDEEYRRENDKNIAELKGDMFALKASTFDLHTEVREVLNVAKASATWIHDAAKVGRDTQYAINCNTGAHDPCQQTDQITLLAASVNAISEHQASMQIWITENSEVTREVRDLLTTFKVSRAVANWITKIGGAIAIIYAGYKGWFSK